MDGGGDGRSPSESHFDADGEESGLRQVLKKVCAIRLSTNSAGDRLFGPASADSRTR